MSLDDSEIVNGEDAVFMFRDDTFKGCKCISNKIGKVKLLRGENTMIE